MLVYEGGARNTLCSTFVLIGILLVTNDTEFFLISSC